LDTYSASHALSNFLFIIALFFLGIWKIWRYKRKTIQVRAKAGLPQLFDADDLPDPLYDPHHVHVLTETEQKDLHRRKYLLPPTFYLFFIPSF
jgi:hypothetical protein